MGQHTRLYNATWRKARATYLRNHPLCVMCDRPTPATVVDHIIPHKGDQALFWNTDNWQSLCKTHHDATKQRSERKGVEIGGDVYGRPLDPNHHWNKTCTK